MVKFWGGARRRLKGNSGTSRFKNTVGKDQESSSSVSKPSLERLSDDLLLDIMELVGIPRTNFPGHPMQGCLGTIDLLSLMRCNRHMYVLGEPILYRNFVESSPIRLPRFIRTVIWRPHLAEFVRNVKFIEKDQTKHDGPNLVQVLSPTDKERIEFLLKSRIIPNKTSPDKIEQSKLEAQTPILPDAFGILKPRGDGDQGSFEEGLQAGKWRFMAGFILSLLPNIEELSVIISWEVGRPTDGLAYVFLTAAKLRDQSTTSPSPNSLSRLRDLTISYRSRSRCPGIWSIFPYLAHHALQSFTGDQVRDRATDSNRYWSLLPPQLRLKSLRLERSNIHTELLHRLLQLCPILENFKYEHDQHLGEVIFEPERFVTSIEHLKHCLRNLVLYRPGKYYQSTECLREEVTTISLFGFEKLTSLFITTNLLLGALKSPKASTIYQISNKWQPPPPSQNLTQCLPKSLEYLCLKECGEGIEDDVSEFVEQATTLTPNLKTFLLTFEIIQPRGIFGYPRGLRMNWGAAKKWEEDCTAKGIEFDVLYN